jgi:hypothetical protein
MNHPTTRRLSRREIRRLRATLIANGGNAQKTARELGLSVTAVARRRDKFGIEPLRRGRPPADPKLPPWEIRERQLARFWSKVDKSAGPEACWPWTGCVSKDYGLFATSAHSSQGAHRFAYEAVHGSVKGKQLHHTCKNTLCVNPAHLTEVPDTAAHMRLERMEKEFVEYVQSDAFLAEMAHKRTDALVEYVQSESFRTEVDLQYDAESYDQTASFRAERDLIEYLQSTAFEAELAGAAC